MLDHDAVEELMTRLGHIPDGAFLNRFLTHLAESVRYSMGRGTPPARRDTWISRLIGAMALRGMLPFSFRMCLFNDRTRNAPPTDLESLHALMLEYLARVQAGETTPFPHPLFGDIGIDGWARYHALHIEYHFKYLETNGTQQR